MRLEIIKKEQRIGPRNGLFLDFQIEFAKSNYHSWFETMAIPIELMTLCRLCYNLNSLSLSMSSTTIYYADIRN